MPFYVVKESDRSHFVDGPFMSEKEANRVVGSDERVIATRKWIDTGDDG